METSNSNICIDYVPEMAAFAITEVIGWYDEENVFQKKIMFYGYFSSEEDFDLFYKKVKVLFKDRSQDASDGAA